MTAVPRTEDIAITRPSPPRPAWARWTAASNDITGQFLAAAGRPGFISLAGGLPAADLYPVEAVRAAADRALTRWGAAALEYGLSLIHI